MGLTLCSVAKADRHCPRLEELAFPVGEAHVGTHSAVVPGNVAVVLHASLFLSFSLHIKSRANLVGSTFRVHPGSDPLPPPASRLWSPSRHLLSPHSCKCPSVAFSLPVLPCVSPDAGELRTVSVTLFISLPRILQWLLLHLEISQGPFHVLAPGFLPDLISPKTCPAHSAAATGSPAVPRIPRPAVLSNRS